MYYSSTKLWLKLVEQVLSIMKQLKNQQYNLLSLAVNLFNQPLDYYYTGEGLSYTLSQNSQFTIEYQPWGPGVVNGAIVAVSSMSVNNNQYIQSYQYFILTQQNTTQYTIYGSIFLPKEQTTLYFTNLLFSIITENCYNINTAQGQIIVTCLTTNQLTYYIYNINTKQVNTIQVSNITADTSATFTTQTAGIYLATLIIQENNNTIQSNIYIFFNEPLQYIQELQPNKGDQITGFSLSQTGLLFYSTLNEGAIVVNIVTTNVISLFNPFGSGTLGISTYNIDYSPDYYYITIWNKEGLMATVFNYQEQKIISKVQLFENLQVSTSNMYQTQVYLNLRYIVLVNNNGISVYPSQFNNINEGLLLFYYPQASIVSAFDYYNNILISIQENGSFTYQFNNPHFFANHLQLTKLILNFTISAVSNSFNKTQVQCPNLTLYYMVVSQPTNDGTTFYLTSHNINGSTSQYNQLGQQFNITFGSSQIVDLNKMIIGPALFIQYPQTGPAFNPDQKVPFQNVLSTPKILSQYSENTNYFDEQYVIYSQLFYDPSCFIGDVENQEFQDTYIQLSQIPSFIILYRCQGKNSVSCEQLYYIQVQEMEVVEFAFGMKSNIIYFAYHYNQIDLEFAQEFAHLAIYQLIPNASSPSNYTVFHNTYNIIKEYSNIETSIKQIAIIQQNLYFILSSQSIQQEPPVTTSQLFVIEAASLATGTASLQDAIPFQFGNSLVGKISYNVPAYGNLLFVSTYQIQKSRYSYALSAVNYNQGSASILGTVSLGFTSQQKGIDYFYFLPTINGIFMINTNTTINPIIFYTRVDLMPLVIQFSMQSKTQLPLYPLTIPMYSITKIKQVAASSRYLYLVVQTSTQLGYSIYIYRITPAVALNSLYYIIQDDMITPDRISVVSAIEYDTIIFKTPDGIGYRRGIILPQFEIEIKSDLSSQNEQQIQYNYVWFKAYSYLFGTTIPSDVIDWYMTFKITNILSFVQEKNTFVYLNQSGQPITLNANGQSFIDPRIYFIGNIQSFSISNPYEKGYFFDINPPVVSPPQRLIYQNGVTAVSAMMTLDSGKNSYWWTFVQTNNLVYITPFIYYTPQNQTFEQNSTVFIDYPLTYKLPILDPKPNSQHCPLIFVDQLSQGIVSVCGIKNGKNFIISFTLYNPNTQQIQETQIINFKNYIPQAYLNDEEATYILQQATYLQLGIVVLQFRYTYNFGQIPPVDIILPFLYAATLDKPTVININGQQSYQMVQPIEAVYFIKNHNLTDLFSVTPFSISTTTLDMQTQDFQPTLIFGLLCVSSTDEECLSSEKYESITSGVSILVQLNSTFCDFLNGAQGIKVAASNLYTGIIDHPFQISLLDAISDYTSNSVQQVVQLGTPFINGLVYEVPFLIASQGTAYVFIFSFYSIKGQYLKYEYSCTLVGLTDQNQILQISTSGFGTNYQVVMVVSNPSTNQKSQVTLLNYGFINEWCPGLPNSVIQVNDYITGQNLNLVTVIGSYNYVSIESTPVLNLMFPYPQLGYGMQQYVSCTPRTFISNNGIIQLLETSPVITLTAYPDYTIYQGVTLSNTTGTISSDGIQTVLTAQPIKVFVNNTLLLGASGSTLFSFNITGPPNLADGKWFNYLSGQWIWGSIMFVIIVGVLAFLCYKSQNIRQTYRDSGQQFELEPQNFA